jgi:hypothetical protein
MALGIKYPPPGETLDLVPIVKYDARGGRFARVDRSNASGQWETTQTDITGCFKAVFDLENIEVGWICFPTSGAPDFRMVPLGEDAGPRPSDAHKEGFRIMLKLGKEAGGDVREFCATAKVVVGAMDELHDKFKAEANGRLPVVAVKTTKPIVTGSGQTKSTNYAPVFEVVQWVPRPADLVFKPKSAKTNGSGKPAPASAPPATGATKVSPPVTETAEDFG